MADVAGSAAVYQCIAVAPDYHSSGIVLAGTESDGLFRSIDGGHNFSPVPDTPSQINALIAVENGWLLSDAEQVWQSSDGLQWQPLVNQGALVLASVDGEVWMGTDEGVQRVNLTPEAAAV
jgi:hypothetical protein